MSKIDLKRQLEDYSARHGTFSIVAVPPRRYLMIDGHGDPNTAERYAEAVSALYAVAYAAKFGSKTGLDRDYVVPPLEALWWSADLASFTTERDKSRWDWTLMNLVPDWIAAEHVDAARAAAARKGVAAVADVRLEAYAEGRCVQTLHIGAYDDEGPVLAAMHDEFIPAQGLRMVGKHHEIYLSDPRRTPASKLKTILRQPVVGADDT